MSLNGVKLWDTHTSGSFGAYLILQNDGDLVVYTSNGQRKLWDSGTSGLVRLLNPLLAAKTAALAAAAEIDVAARALVTALVPRGRRDIPGGRGFDLPSAPRFAEGHTSPGGAAE